MSAGFDLWNDCVEMSALVGQRLDVSRTGDVTNSHLKNAVGAIGGIGIVGTRGRAKKNSCASGRVAAGDVRTLMRLVSRRRSCAISGLRLQSPIRVESAEFESSRRPGGGPPLSLDRPGARYTLFS